MFLQYPYQAEALNPRQDKTIFLTLAVTPSTAAPSAIRPDGHNVDHAAMAQECFGNYAGLSARIIAVLHD